MHRFTLLFFFLLSQSISVVFGADAVSNQMHEAIYKASDFPSATLCQTCHSKQFREWSVSQHAYAQISPVFMAMQNTTNREQSSTAGDFCIRCHTPIGMLMDESIFASNLKRSAIAREGVTCAVCHRQNIDYGKVSARVILQKGSLTAPIYGPRGNQELARVFAHPNEYKVVTDPNEKGRKIHQKVEPFFALTTPKFCGTCHDVLLINGFRLEEAFSEFLHSPAAERGETCQDCHMGKQPGIAKGYDWGSAAEVGEVKTKPRKLTNHYFAGPDYPIVHPGIFPVNTEAQELATIEQWLAFDEKAGWGTDAFEEKVTDETQFPKPWDSADARYDAREILDDQFELLAWAKKQRQHVLAQGYQLGEIKLDKFSAKGLEFRIQVRNGSDGHNVPTGFIAERLVFLEVNVYDAKGELVYQSGDRDPNGDVRDLHSLYVHAGQLPLDNYLFNLQSKFLIRNNRGGEREAIIPINRSLDPRPFVRPAPFSSVLTGSPANARIHRKGIPPKSARWARYTIPAQQLKGHSGPYRVSVKLIAQMVPVNLIARIQEVGFDFHMSAKEVAEAVVKGAHVVAEREEKLEV